MSALDGSRILVVEDDVNVRSILTLQLRSRGFVIQAAADGAQGYAALQGDLPDCVILDLMMPVMDGFGLLKRIRSMARTAALPVVILTASEDERHRLKGLQYQADAYLSKPYELDKLVQTVHRLLGSGRTA